MNKLNRAEIHALLQDAQKNGYAIPHFNFNDNWDLLAICEIANEMRAPVFVATVPIVSESLGMDLASAMADVMQSRADVPLMLHLDHATRVSACLSAIEAGYPSVMIDASALSLDENVAAIEAVQAKALPDGVHVEAEIGRIRGRDEAEGTYMGDDFLVRVDDAAKLVERTQVDMLAVGVGTQHGFYRGKPEINFERIRQIREAIPTPLVLHGGTGIPEADVRRAIQCGIAKVNVGTMIRYTYLTGIREQIELQGAEVHPARIVKPVLEQIKAVVRKWILVCGAENRV